MPSTGQALPISVAGEDGGVVGPIRFDGPTWITLETLAPRLAFDGDPTTSNYQVRPTDARGRPGDLVVNSLGPAPETLGSLWFPGEATVGYLDVRSFGPWRATVAPA